MATSKIFPTRISDFDVYIQSVVPYINDNAATLVVSTTNVSALAGLKKQWDITYPAAANKTTSTTTLRTQRDSLVIQFKTLLRVIYDDIPRSVLTQTDRDTLNLKQRDGVATRYTATDYYPTLSIDKMIHLMHTLRFKNPTDPASRKMPKGQKIILQWAITPPPLATTAATAPLFNNEKNITKALTDIRFDASDAGSTVSYQCCYESTRGDRGPMSSVLTAVIA
jgi:hypothetical protein